MDPIREMHHAAMAYADIAFIGRIKRWDPAIIHAAQAQAYALEQTCAYAYPIDEQPGSLIIHRSAATLAVACGLEREARALVDRVLARSQYPGMTQELRDVLTRIDSGWWVNEPRLYLPCARFPGRSTFHITTEAGVSLCRRFTARMEPVIPDSWEDLCRACGAALTRHDISQRRVLFTHPSLSKGETSHVSTTAPTTLPTVPASPTAI